MLYRLGFGEEGTGSIEPEPFQGLHDLEKLERDLEEILAANMLDVLFEEAQLFPMFRQRPQQREADLYALDQQGNLVIFELKRGTAGPDAVAQLVTYAQDAGRWTYKDLNARYRKFVGNTKAELRHDHQEAFFLDEPLTPQLFNKRQGLRVVGHAADDGLRQVADYWKRQGLDMDFLPYRVYEFAGQLYLEFFSPPYDHHRNPAHRKGVLFDTNASWNPNSVWEMFEGSRVSAYGDARRFVQHIYPGDTVFFYHRGKGVVAAAEVIGRVRSDGEHEDFRDVRFLSTVPTREEGLRRALPPSRVSEVTGRSFYWARTIKVPYLTAEETEALLTEVRETIGPQS